MASGILVFSLRGTWASILSLSVEGAKRKSLRKIWARTPISILPSTMPVPRKNQEHI